MAKHAPANARPETISEIDAMRRAVQLSRDGMQAGAGGPFGAVVLRDGEIIGEGCNQVTSTCDPTAHAEIVAIRAACTRLGTFSLAGCTLVSSCEPCPMCLAAAHWARCDAVIFGASRRDAARAGFDDALLYEEIDRLPADRVVPGRALLSDEAAQVFDEWLAKEDRVPY